MPRCKLVLAGLIALTAPALADDDDPTVGGGIGGDASMGSGASGDATAAASTGARLWPQEVIDRAYVRNKKGYTVYANAGFAVKTTENMATMMPESTTLIPMQLGAGYAATDDLTAGLQYAFIANPFEIQGPLDIFVNYQLIHELGKMSVAANLDLTFDLCASKAPDMAMPMQLNCVSSKTIRTGLGAKYLLDSKMMVFTGSPIGPGTFGRHLKIGLDSDTPIDLDVPVGFGYQASRQLFGFAQINLATFHFNPKMMQDTAEFFIDTQARFDLGALYSVDKNLDVGGIIGDDLKSIGDAISMVAFARYYGG